MKHQTNKLLLTLPLLLHTQDGYNLTNQQYIPVVGISCKSFDLHMVCKIILIVKLKPLPLDTSLYLMMSPYIYYVFIITLFFLQDGLVAKLLDEGAVVIADSLFEKGQHQVALSNLAKAKTPKALFSKAVVCSYPFYHHFFVFNMNLEKLSYSI